jgi:NAD(P)-dependent dehydrogenase (short-subunit alcohol dehydrogenase family)
MSKTILITGGSRGIGRATALLAAVQGWSVGINYLGNQAAANETARAIEQAGGRAAILRGDISSEADVIALFDGMERAFGPLDYLINNAGVVAPGAKLADMDLDRLQRIFAINILGAYLCAREAARRLSTARGGKGGGIVNVSSGAALRGAPGSVVHVAGGL